MRVLACLSPWPSSVSEHLCSDTLFINIFINLIPASVAKSVRENAIKQKIYGLKQNLGNALYTMYELYKTM